eukprot:1148159-Pelagomonas_calceolata.AAC.1
MSKSISVCAPLRAGRIGSCYPPWLDAACKQETKVFREAVQNGLAEHARKFACEQFHATASLYSRNPELLAMLRKPKRYTFGSGLII